MKMSLEQVSIVVILLIVRINLSRKLSCPLLIFCTLPFLVFPQFVCFHHYLKQIGTHYPTFPHIIETLLVNLQF